MNLKKQYLVSDSLILCFSDWNIEHFKRKDNSEQYSIFAAAPHFMQIKNTHFDGKLPSFVRTISFWKAIVIYKKKRKLSRNNQNFFLSFNQWQESKCGRGDEGV